MGRFTAGSAEAAPSPPSGARRCAAWPEGKPRLVRLNPESGDAAVGQDDSDEGVVAYTMTCHSGGSLEVYVEPFAPPSRLLVIGDSPVARSLLALGPPLGFDTGGG